MDSDILVIGGGIVGAAIAYGLARHGLKVTVLDEGDRAIRSARVNFGLVWVQGKGNGMPAYAGWTRRSAALWPALAADLAEEAGLDVELSQPGGVAFCLGEEEMEAARQHARRLHNQADIHEIEVIDRTRLQGLMPRAPLGPEVAGASFCRHDGHVNPLLLLRGLHRAMQRRGAVYRPEAPVTAIRATGGGFLAETPQGRFAAGKLVLAAGHGNPALAGALGLAVPIRAERGQILVTERLDPFLPLPAGGLRQTGDGTVMIGATKEDVGLDTSTTVAAGVGLAARAVRTIPALAGVTLVRSWAGLRVLTPDGHPAYAQSASCPGAFIAVCHSGVTLAAAHAGPLADAIAAGRLTDELAPFHPGRFDVPAAA